MFDLTIPYSTGSNNSTAIFASSYIVKIDNAITSVVVKESQVKNGETINLELTAKDSGN